VEWPRQSWLSSSPRYFNVQPTLGKYRIFLGRWIPLPGLTWFIPAAWLLAFAVFAIVPGVYATYRSEFNAQQSQIDQLTERPSEVSRNLKRPHVILLYGRDPATPREQWEVLARNIGEAHAREVVIDPFSEGSHEATFEAIPFLEAGATAALPFTVEKGKQFDVMFGHDFYFFADERLDELQPNFQDRESVVAELMLRYKDPVGEDFESHWSVVMDVTFAATEERQRALSFRERGIARDLPQSKPAVYLPAAPDARPSLGPPLSRLVHRDALRRSAAA